MRPRYWIAAASAALLAAALVVAVPRTANSQDEKKERVAEIADFMAGIHKPSMENVASIFQTPPKTDKEWAKVRRSAALLNESGHLLMQNDRCPDAVWAKACADLRAFTATYVEAATKKDLDGAKAACAKIAASCKSCHDQHREEEK